MQILNKDVNLGNVVYMVSNSSKVSDTNVTEVKEFISVVEELKREEKSVFNINDFTEARKRERANKLVRIRRPDEHMKNAGFALVCSITTIGILVMGLLIFMAIKLFVLG